MRGKRAEPEFDQTGLYGGEQSLEWFRAWQFHDYRTTEVFGEPWIHLPLWLQRDLLTLINMRAWHEANRDRPVVMPGGWTPFQ